MIRCRICSEDKEESEFYANQKTCKVCYNKRHAERKRQRRSWIQQYKLQRGCSNCGYNEHPAALQFDHIDPSTKEFELSGAPSLSMERIKKEIAKCRILCANCHMIHTHYPDHLGLDKEDDV